METRGSMGESNGPWNRILSSRRHGWCGVVRKKGGLTMKIKEWVGGMGIDVEEGERVPSCTLTHVLKPCTV